MNKQQVTERDIRQPQFRDAKLEDLEFDGSGEVVRKDRFETSMRKILGTLHGVNGLSVRSSWTCEQVVEAVKETKNKFERLKELLKALDQWPDDAEFYHFQNKTYIKNIDQEHLEIAKKEPDIGHLINHDFLQDGGWEATAVWLEYIEVLVSSDDVRNEIELILRGEHEQ